MMTIRPRLRSADCFNATTYFIVLLFILVLCATLVSCSHKSSEPAYQGRTLTEWLNDYSNPLQGVDPRDPKAQTIVPQNLQHAREAIEATGTNAIPTLLDLAQSPLPAKRDLAYTGFVVLGPKGSSARQQLIQLIQHPDSDIRMLAAKCLVAINPADKSTLIPIYTKLASDPDTGNRREATNMLQLLKFDPAKASLEKFK